MVQLALLPASGPTPAWNSVSPEIHPANRRPERKTGQWAVPQRHPAAHQKGYGRLRRAWEASRPDGQRAASPATEAQLAREGSPRASEAQAPKLRGEDTQACHQPAAHRASKTGVHGRACRRRRKGHHRQGCPADQSQRHRARHQGWEGSQPRKLHGQRPRRTARDGGTKKHRKRARRSYDQLTGRV